MEYPLLVLLFMIGALSLVFVAIRFDDPSADHITASASILFVTAMPASTVALAISY